MDSKTKIQKSHLLLVLGKLANAVSEICTIQGVFRNKFIFYIEKSDAIKRAHVQSIHHSTYVLKNVS
jgi:hypothetical protein